MGWLWGGQEDPCVSSWPEVTSPQHGDRGNGHAGRAPGQRGGPGQESLRPRAPPPMLGHWLSLLPRTVSYQKDRSGPASYRHPVHLHLSSSP